MTGQTYALNTSVNHSAPLPAPATARAPLAVSAGVS
jgi:hypothetical protein